MDRCENRAENHQDPHVEVAKAEQGLQLDNETALLDVLDHLDQTGDPKDLRKHSEPGDFIKVLRIQRGNEKCC